jgi:hypothetical protein
MLEALLLNSAHVRKYTNVMLMHFAIFCLHESFHCPLVRSGNSCKVLEDGVSDLVCAHIVYHLTSI